MNRGPVKTFADTWCRNKEVGKRASDKIIKYKSWCHGKGYYCRGRYMGRI